MKDNSYIEFPNTLDLKPYSFKYNLEKEVLFSTREQKKKDTEELEACL